jgi:hypothetical protein
MLGSKAQSLVSSQRRGPSRLPGVIGSETLKSCFNKPLALTIYYLQIKDVPWLNELVD